MPETPRIITKIDVLVHPDYNLIGGEGKPTLSSGDRNKLRMRWLDRASAISTDPHSALFYYSAFLRQEFTNIGRGDVRIKRDRPDLWMIDRARIGELRSLLGPKLFVFPGNLFPLASEIKQDLARKNMQIDPQRSVVYSYGEYYERCVNFWGRGVEQEVVNDSRRNSSREKTYFRLEDLSLNID